jgi:hypothetical protein
MADITLFALAYEHVLAFTISSPLRISREENDFSVRLSSERLSLGTNLLFIPLGPNPLLLGKKDSAEFLNIAKKVKGKRKHNIRPIWEYRALLGSLTPFRVCIKNSLLHKEKKVLQRRIQSEQIYFQIGPALLPARNCSFSCGMLLMFGTFSLQVNL